ncbi:MAG: hypothetical protein OHK0038_12990 [Flammeovirgaceae bacterium]
MQDDMSDIEYQVMDELYFLTSFHKLMENTELEEIQLKNCLENLIKKGWVRCFEDTKGEYPIDEIDFNNKFTDYQYLATKKGLLAHNSI